MLNTADNTPEKSFDHKKIENAFSKINKPCKEKTNIQFKINMV